MSGAVSQPTGRINLVRSIIGSRIDGSSGVALKPVSYTHLTLPTKA